MATLPSSILAAIRHLARYHRWLLLGLWLLVQAAYLAKYHGPHYANDSARYLNYAANLAEHGYYKIAPGTAPTTIANNGLANFQYEHNQRYILYPWFQSVWLRLHAGWWGIVLGQLAISGLAALALYSAVRQLASGQLGAAAVATALFIGWPDVQQFNCFLLTESLFISLSVLSCWAFVRTRGSGWGAWLLLLGLLLLTALVRPNGFVVAGAVGLAGLATLFTKKRRVFWLAVGAAVLATPLAVWWLNHQLVSFYIVETYVRGELMFATPVWAVHPSAPLVLPPDGIGQMSRVLYFAAHNPGFLAKLMLGKLLVFFSSIKPYYSLSHKLMSVLVLWPLYYLAVRGARLASVWLPGRAFLVGVPLLQAAVVMLTVDDYDVRFLAPVLPFVFALAGLAIREWLEGMNIRK
ncbi:hypothetical protein GCM10023172_18850 [Hymenobacter ginsengisoli]|uniref:Glycosyltransferase RgtA/B/C/D-like domain-containing protein n=1 Tax=Hymenobacter ginsengisoli TaxID=1051626 RepID=A0ABP8QC51_9BACT|nr:MULTISPECIES: hypothetical protein [unclassified Hymenobacter]MBO2031556.1 hypothetical protein [Hymenobacter sp. BT559]